VRVGHVYLDVRSRRLHCLDEAARALHAEGVPFTARELTHRPLHTRAGQPVRARDLPLLVAWRTGRAAEGEFVLSREGGISWLLHWTAAPVPGGGTPTGVVASVCASPPGFDWQALAGLAHDLRTPLQAFACLLAVWENPALDEVGRADLLRAARQAAERAVQIANDLLLWCRGPGLAGRRPDPSWFALAPLAEDLVREQAAAAAAKGLTLNARIAAARGFEIRADRLRLGRLLANLVANAVRYTATGRVAVMAHWRDAPGGRSLVLGVMDTGTGIAAEELESIFQPFERGQAARAGDSGSGLGLAVVERLAGELGLELEVHSRYGHGSAFHVLVPPHLLRPVGPVGGSAV
jgi:hypothetical protein